jgi:hypothetical protein
MKAILMMLLAGSMWVCSCQLVKHGQIICKEKKGCENFTVNNGLTLRFKEAEYSFSFRRNDVAFFCELKNNSGNPLIFNRQFFSIVSKEYEYNVMPGSTYKNGKRRLFPDTISLAPGEFDKDFVLYFRSKNTMSRKGFRKFCFSDTLKLMFANADKKDTVLQLIGREDR